MDKDLLVLLEPSIHLAELELDEPVELVIVIYSGRGFRPAVPDNDVVDVVLLGLEGVHEILLRHVFHLEEVVWIVRLQPAGMFVSQSRPR